MGSINKREITKYTVKDYGLEEDKRGSYIHIIDVVNILNHCLDDDSKIQERVLKFREDLIK